MSKWLLDAGHGGTDPGAVLGSRKESTDTLKMALSVGAILKANGEEVGYTRTTDTFVSLNNRCTICNNGKYDYFVSFHRDSFSSIASGASVFAYALGGEAAQLGLKVDAFMDTLFRDRGSVKTANYQVLRSTNAPAILIECGFINNQADNKILDDNFNKIANGIAKACLNHIGKDISSNSTVIGDISNSTSNESNNTITNTNSTTECIQGYNATVKNDFFYTRNSLGVKDGGRIEISTKIKVLDVSYSKQLVYIAYLENNAEKKAYITNAPNCIEYLYANQWTNGSTKEIVYETSSCKNSIGELSPREKATPIYRENGILHVVYNTSKGVNSKSGYVKYNGGFTKL